MADINLDPSIGEQRPRPGNLGNPSVPASRPSVIGNGRLAVLALMIGDITTALLAFALSNFVLLERTQFQDFEPFNVLLLLACCYAFGLYTEHALRPHERLRQRAYAILVFVGVNLFSPLSAANFPEARSHWAIQAALLLSIGFYVELLVLRTIAPRRDSLMQIALRENGTPQAVQTEVVALRLHPLAQLLKRAIDLAISLPAAVLLLPLFGLIMLAIKVIDPGPAFYVQTRVGRDGREIRLFKFRSMYVDADRRLREHLQTNEEARLEWSRYFKLRDDPRILPHIGRLLRRSSMDELPQLWNVMFGDMTLVGPRPLPEYHAASFDPEFQRLRSSVTPGVTGFCQVSARRAELEGQKAHDLFYIQNQSVWLDLYILLQTVPAVLSGNGAR